MISNTHCPAPQVVSYQYDTMISETNLLGEVCKDVCIEPQLQPLTGENLRYKTASTENEARFDVSDRGFWVRGSRAFTDIRVFNPLARTYRSQNLTAAYKRNENEKKRKYSGISIKRTPFVPRKVSALTKCPLYREFA